MKSTIKSINWVCDGILFCIQRQHLLNNLDTNNIGFLFSFRKGQKNIFIMSTLITVLLHTIYIRIF